MGKPRVIISTDIGGADPDDDQSMVHALLYADKLDIEAIISTPSKHGGRASDIHQVIDKYSQDYSKLKTWSSEYPTPDYLKSVVYQGNINVAPSAGYSSATAGSNAIIKAAKAASSSDPVWVLTWGSMTDLAQALHDDPSIKSNIKVYSIGAWNDQQDPNARNYVYNNHKDLWWIENDSTFRGMYVDQYGAEKNTWKMGDAQGHGALGDYFYSVRPWGLKMGDTPSLLYLLDTANNLTPGATSWGGAFKQTGHGPNYWTDNPDSALRDGTYNGSETVRIHQQSFYQDFAQRLDRAKSTNPNATNVDDPVAANNDAATTDKDKAIVVKVLLNDTAPDGGLKIASADATSANGGKVVVNLDGTITYTPKLGFVGTDTFKYVARDTDGDLNDAIVTMTVKTPTTTTPTTPGTGTGNPVVAGDDSFKVTAGTKHYFNTNHLLYNDKGLDGGLKVTIGTVTTSGVTLEKWADGTIVYRAPTTHSGSDRIDYVLTDRDGSSDTGTIVFNISGGTISAQPPAPTEPTPTDPTPVSGGTGNPVVATDDSYKLTAGTKHYFNSNHLLYNDKGLDGGLKVTIGNVTNAGVTLEKWADGTIVYRTPTTHSGQDRIDYVLTDKDGSSDTGTVFFNISGGAITSSVTATAMASSADPQESMTVTTQPTSSASLLTGADNGLIAADDVYKIDMGKTLYLNTRYVTTNDKGGTGSLSVIAVDAASERGVAVSWGAEGTAKDGTLVYKAPVGFEGTDRITYKVVDQAGHSDLGTILVHVGTYI